MKNYKFLIFTIFFLPSFVFAADPPLFEDVLGNALGLVKNLFPILVALAVTYFLWGVIKYIRLSDNPEERIKGRDLMIHGIIAIFVMVSLWGLVGILVDTFFDSPDDLIIRNPDDVPQYDINGEL
ncbi:pilin [Patescibacteria group bacterium]|nr:pilin [Patescibacteria group bacterium]MBU1246639.1 pilin [Patescibacteria group bacterium]MBU1519677.1 pilin [Patescibacteria group bacterium]MBU1730548.1 pilin [Patescibacteria group bacterium]MBU1956129.1 pilin [Patescibacteria group bacterium]